MIKKALYTILISLGLALIFNFLFFQNVIGISFFIFAVVLLSATSLFGLQILKLRQTWWIILLIGFFSFMVSLRANEFLTFLNVVATFGLLMLLAHELAGTPTFLMRIFDYLKLAVLVPFKMLGRALSTISLVGQYHSNEKHRDVWIRIAKGVIMAIPILIIFGILFSNADLAFSQFLNNIVNINISENAAQYTFMLVFAFVAALCFLSYIFFPKQEQLSKQSDQIQLSRGVEVMVFLGLISTLFVVFIVFQITYLFGGESNIVNAGFTYAEYARRGFFELLVVAILALVVLLASEKFSGAESKKDLMFLIPAIILIIEIGIIILSAFKRLSLYIDAYGMTMLRFYVAGFIILLSVLFILLAIKFIKSKPEQFFAFGTLLSVLSFVIIANLINPDAFIVKANMDQYKETGKIDAAYNRELSPDATTQKIELYNMLEGEDKIILQGLLQDEKNKLESITDWQSANFSRSKALKLLQEF